MAFRTEAGVRSKGKPLVRWAGSILARLEGAPAPTYAAEITRLLRRLETLTGLSMRLVRRNEPSNLLVTFLSTAEIRKKLRMPKANCAGTLSGSRGIIRSAQVYISTDSDWRTRHCIVEEISQILGLRNDTIIIADSIFNDDSRRASLSLADQIIVRALYDRHLKPGMTRTRAMPIARRVIAARAARVRSGATRGGG